MGVEAQQVRVEASDVLVFVTGDAGDSGSGVVLERGADVASFEPGDLVDWRCRRSSRQTWVQGAATLACIPLAEYNVFPRRYP